MASIKIQVTSKEFNVIRKEIKMIENVTNTQKRIGLLISALVAFSLLAARLAPADAGTALRNRIFTAGVLIWALLHFIADVD